VRHPVRHRGLIEQLVAAREAQGLSQRALAKLLKRSPSYVSRYEGGDRRLEVGESLEICDTLRADPLKLLGPPPAASLL
jgi:transcriptional regulator with XRE-family HTH domain